MESCVVMSVDRSTVPDVNTGDNISMNTFICTLRCHSLSGCRVPCSFGGVSISDPMFLLGCLCLGRPPGQRPPWTETSLDRDPLDRDVLDRDALERDLPGQRPPWRETPGQKPLDRDPLDRDPPCRVKSRWYASYWNAFLLIIIIIIIYFRYVYNIPVFFIIFRLFIHVSEKD